MSIHVFDFVGCVISLDALTGRARLRRWDECPEAIPGPGVFWPPGVPIWAVMGCRVPSSFGVVLIPWVLLGMPVGQALPEHTIVGCPIMNQRVLSLSSPNRRLIS